MHPFTLLFSRGRGMLFAAFVTVLSFGAKAATTFPPDVPGAASYTLPDPLLTKAGKKIASADEWRSVRRPEVLELFREHVYGRVPATAYTKTFKVVREDRNAMEGAATLKQVEIGIE